jgi:hypothetical protein
MTVTAARPSQTGDYPSFWQFLLSAAAVLFLWVLSALLGLLAVIGRLSGDTPVGNELPVLLVAAGLALSGLLVLPSAVLAAQRFYRRPAAAFLTRWPRALRPNLLIFLFPPVLAAGAAVSALPEWAWVLLPPLHVLAISLPVAWLLGLAWRGLPSGSPQRVWGGFAVGLALAPSVILVVELLVVMLLGGLVLLGAAASPAWQSELTFLAQWITIHQPGPDEILQYLTPYLSNPLALYLGLTLLAGFVPLVEEALKPMALWFLGGRLSPARGFTLGALSGAGFALYENLLITSSGQDWVLLVTARVGTALVHIFTTALSGWALAHAWKRGAYLRLGLTYLGVVCVHALWNGVSVFSGYSALLVEIGQPAPELNTLLGPEAIYVLAALTVILFVLLLVFNGYLRRKLHTA